MEYAGVQGALHKARAVRVLVPREEPREDGALPSPPRLRHAVHRLLHDANALDAVALADRNHVHGAVEQ
eukprot:6019009-Prymnesium_polylepis.2